MKKINKCRRTLSWLIVAMTTLCALVGMYSFIDKDDHQVHAEKRWSTIFPGAANYANYIETIGDVPVYENIAEGVDIKDSFNIVSAPHSEVSQKYPNIIKIVDKGVKNKAYAMWYKKPISLEKPFRAHFYVYGKAPDESHMEKAGAGMTFTVQGQGTGAIGQPGQSLGAYGSTKSPYGGYIEKSFSIEFDAKKDSPFDSTTNDITNTSGHYALTYPTEPALGHPDSAKPVKGKLTHTPSPAIPGSAGLQPLALHHGIWQKVIIEYTPDKNNLGKFGYVAFPEVSNSLFKVNLRDMQGADKYYWGITGATDDKDTMTGAIALAEPIQEPLMIKEVRNVTRDKIDGGERFGAHVKAAYGDELEYKFWIDNPFDFGLGETWQNVVIKDTLPNGIVTLDGQQSTRLNVGSVAPGAGREVKFRAKVETKQVGLKLTNYGYASGSNGIQDPHSVKSSPATVYTDDDISQEPEKEPEKEPEEEPEKEPEKEAGVNLNISTMIFNTTAMDADNHNGDFTEQYNVKEGHKLNYMTTISNTVPNSELTNGKVTFEIPRNAQLDRILIGGKTYKWDSIEIDGGYRIVVHNFSIGAKESKSMQVDVTVKEFAIDFMHTSKVTVSGENKDKTPYSKTGNPVSAFFVKDEEEDEGNIELMPHDIDYGAIPPQSNNQTINRLDSTNAPQIVCEVNDTRKNKTPAKLTVSQDDIFKRIDDSVTTLQDSHLRYYGDGSVQRMQINTPILIGENPENEPLSSVIWAKDKGIRFYSQGQNFSVGHYKTTLTWTIVSGY